MKRLFSFASSLRTGIFLLATLTILSLVGVIIPQGLEAHRYIDKWGDVAGGILLRIGLDRIFSTVWYNTILALFGLNVFLCTVNRLKGVYVSLTRPSFLTSEKINRLPFRKEFTAMGRPEAVADKVCRFFRERRFSTFRSGNNEGILIDATKGKIREIGSALLHLCIIPLLIGGLLGRIKGFSYIQELMPGEIAPVRERPFSVRCDFFKVERNENGEVSDYKSGLTLLDSSGDTLAQKVIEVNSPLAYNGIKFYQSSYRDDPFNIDNIQLVVTGPLIGAIGKKVTLQPGRTVIVPGTDISVRAEGFMPDFYYDMKTRKPHNRSPGHNNPAIFVTLTKGPDTLFARWVFKLFGTMHHEEDLYGASFLSYDRRQSTGLLIKKNPGSGLVWLGIIGMSTGILLIFWTKNIRYRAAIESRGENSVVTIGCTHRRDDTETAASLLETASAQLSSGNKENESSDERIVI